MNRASMVGRKLKKGFEEFKPSFEALKAGKPITKTEKYVSELLEQYEQSSVNRGKLLELSKKHTGKDKELCQEACTDLLRVSNEEMSIGQMLIKLAENQYTFKDKDGSSRKYWARLLCESASELEDTLGILAIIKDPELAVAHTAARKAFRIIDFVNYGPKVE